MRSYSGLHVSLPEEIGNLQGANELSSRSREMKLRKNEMKLRKNQIISRKNFLSLGGGFSLSPEAISIPSVGVIGGDRGDRRDRTSNGCRDARSVRPLCQRLQRPLVLTGTDAQIVRPYSRYTSRRSTTDAPIVRPSKGLLVPCVPTKGYSSCFDSCIYVTGT